MPTHALGDRLSRPADAAVGFDSRGYVLAPGDDGPDTVKPATNADKFIGVNYRSTLNLTDSDVDLGRPIAVQIDGYGPVLAEADEYEVGDRVYVDDTVEDGVVSKTGEGAFVGVVLDDNDISEIEADYDLIQVSYTGNAGGHETGAV